MRAVADGGAIPEFDLIDRMRKALRHAGLRPFEMAEWLGVTRETVSRWLTGATNPSAPMLRLWSIHTGVDHDWLVTGAAPISET